MLGWLALVSLLLGGLFVYLVMGGGGLEAVTGWPMAAGVALMLLALYAVATGSLRDGGHIRRLIAPAAVIAALTAAIVFFFPKIDLIPVLSRLAGATNETPGNVSAGAQPQSLKSVRIRRNADGQFIARGDVNGMPASFLIDTGASTVVLKQSDAEHAGIDTATLAFTVPLSTANGETKAAPVRLRNVTIGSIRIEGLEALVAAPGSLNENLLGMTFLRRLRHYELSGDFITLRE